MVVLAIAPATAPARREVMGEGAGEAGDMLEGGREREGGREGEGGNEGRRK